MLSKFVCFLFGGFTLFCFGSASAAPVDLGTTILSFSNVGDEGRYRLFSGLDVPNTDFLQTIEDGESFTKELSFTFVDPNPGQDGDSVVLKVELTVQDEPGAGNSTAWQSLSFTGTTGTIFPSPTDPDTPTFFLTLSDAPGFSTATFTGTGQSGIGSTIQVFASAVPIPAAGILFGSALLVAGVVRRKAVQAKLGLPA